MTAMKHDESTSAAGTSTRADTSNFSGSFRSTFMIHEESTSAAGTSTRADTSNLDGSFSSTFMTREDRKASTRTLLRTDSMREELKIVHASNDRAKKEMAELTINKLDLNSLGLVGRDRELSTLRSCFYRLCSPQSNKIEISTTPSDCTNTSVNKELVLIQGYSGIGKSTLVQSLKIDVSSSNGVCVEGKYELNSIDEPYSAVAQAFGDLCNKLKDRPSPSGDVVAKVTKTINESMKEEAAMLMGLIPELNMFSFSDDSATDKSVQSRTISTSNEHERWKHAFRMLTRILGSHFAVIVVVLDDIQWADAASVDIMDFLISDVENPHPLMIIGCYRSNELDENSFLYDRITALEEKHEKFGFQITDITLENFDFDAVNTMVMTMLSIHDDSETRDLSEVCFKRTLGNPFFLIEFMKMLEAESLLVFNFGLMKWVWDGSKIEDATMSTSNVVDLLQARMRKLPGDAQLLLQCAACLGASFSFPTLEFVWSQYALRMSKYVDDPDLMAVLDVVRKEKLVESCGPGEFRWIHDKVQEAALSLSDLVTPSFQFGLGVCLYEGLDGPQLEKQLFNVADLVNKGNVTERSDPELSKLNLEAAKKARQMAAFQSGVCYVFYGIQLLPFDAWTKHQDVALELHSVGTEMNLALGNIGVAKKYIQVVLDQKRYTAMQTMRLKMSKLEILDKVMNRHSDAIAYGVEVLKEIGYKFVWWRILVPIEAMTYLYKTIKRLEKVPVAHFNSLGLMQDAKQKAIVTLLTKIAVASYQGNDEMYLVLCCCKVIELTLEYGLHANSASQIAVLAMLVMLLKNDHGTSSHFCDIAFAIQKRFGRYKAGATIYYSIAFTLGYVKPLHEVLSLVMDGYSLAMRDGDNFCGIWNLLLRYLILPYIMGRPLCQIAEDCKRISAQIEEAQIAEQIFTFRATWQMIVNLQLPPCESSKRADATEAPFQTASVNFAVGELLLFFGDHEARTMRLMGEEKGKTVYVLSPGYIFGRIDTFHRGIAWFAMARENRKRMYRAEALKIKKLVGKWAKAGDPNVQHYHRMLCAEEAALKKKYGKADKLYKEAIALAARSGHLHHSALFNERYGEYRLEVYDDTDDNRYYMEQAIKYYTEWGAVGKAEDLREKIWPQNEGLKSSV